MIHYDVFKENEDSIDKKIFDRGCVEGFLSWVERNIILIGAIALGIALVQVKLV